MAYSKGHYHVSGDCCETVEGDSRLKDSIKLIDPIPTSLLPLLLLSDH